MRIRTNQYLFLITIFALLTALLGCGKNSEKAAETPSLTLFVAASLTDVLQEIGDAYSQNNSVDMVYNFAGSGALARQLLEVPRADLFLSASERWMDRVEEGNRLLSGSRYTLLSNSLVVIANKGADYEIASPTDLCGPSFRYISIGDPASVPAGRYARRWLESLQCPDGSSVWNRIENRVAPAPDVRAALAQVEGSVDVVGIVYRTDYIARQEAVRLVYELPVSKGPKIEYPVAVIKATESPDLARAFLEFLGGSTARVLFAEHGFTLISGK